MKMVELMRTHKIYCRRFTNLKGVKLILLKRVKLKVLHGLGRSIYYTITSLIRVEAGVGQSQARPSCEINKTFFRLRFTLNVNLIHLDPESVNATYLNRVCAK